MNYYRILAGWFILFMNSSFIYTDSNCRSTIPPYEPLSDEQISKINSSINLLSAQAYVGADAYIRCIIKIDPEPTCNCDKSKVAKQCNSCEGKLCPGCRDPPNKTCWNCWFRNGEKLPMQEPNKYDYDISQKKEVDFSHPSGQHLSQYYEFHLIIRNVTEKDAGYYNTELLRLCENEGSYSNHSAKLTIKEPSFNCLQKTTMEVLDTKDEYYVDIFCSVEGAPHSHVQFLWFSEHGIIATDSEGECSYSNGLNITRRLRISRKRAERLKMIYCNVTNSLIKNRSCLYEAYISPIPDYTWSFIVSIILGSAILSVISVSIYLKATENRNLISMLETYIYIKKTNVLLIQSQPFITEDMEKFCQAITTKHNVNVLRAIPTRWIDMKTIRESLTRFKVIICVISEATKSNTVQKRFQFKDWVCNIIEDCLEISNDDIPPLFIIMNDKLNQDEYEDDINTLEYITCNDKLTEEQRERLEESFSRFYDKDWTI